MFDYVSTGLIGITAYAIYGAIWRLYLSPIAKFPGPRIAALTSLYEAYYNSWLGGKYIYRIEEMHRQYGPIVRISPIDLHVGDPDFYDTLYPGSSTRRKVNKTPSLTKFFGLDDSLFSTIDHDVHRMRRAALLPAFSTQYVRKLQPLIQERIDVLLKRMSQFKDTDIAVNANCMFAAFSNDFMQLLSFGRCAHKLEDPDFDSKDRDASLSGAMSFHTTKRWPWLNNVLMALPESLVRRFSPAMGSFMQQKWTTRKWVEELDAAPEAQFEGKDTQPLVRTILKSTKLPAYETTVERVAQDAQMLLMAGTLTTASTLEHMMYWMVDNPAVLQKLKDELHGAMPSIDDVGKVPLTTLEALPYLTAVIKESIRLIYGNSTPHFRADPDSPLEYEDKIHGRKWVIPPKTPVGMSSVLLHHNEDNFPNSSKFDPERWLGEDSKKLERYNVGFGKGGRICLGMNQAYGLLRLMTAQVWRLWASPGAKIGDEVGLLQLYNTNAHDVEMSGDFFIAAYNKPQGVEFKLSSM